MPLRRDEYYFISRLMEDFPVNIFIKNEEPEVVCVGICDDEDGTLNKYARR